MGRVVSKRVVFFGTEEFSARFLTALIEANYDVAAVVTKPDTKKGRGQNFSAPLVKIIAESHSIPVLQPVKLVDIIEYIESLGAVYGVLVSYGKIVPESVINCFKPGIINVHPSMLPSYRGPSPIETAILNGDEQTGVSIMQLSKKMDAGPVYSQIPLPLKGTETKKELYETIGNLAETELLSVLPSILDGSCLATRQDESRATYCQLLQKTDGMLDAATSTANESERKVRAYADFPKVRAEFYGHSIIVLKAHVTKEPKTPLHMTFYDKSILSIDEVVAPSGKTMSADAFIRGYAA